MKKTYQVPYKGDEVKREYDALAQGGDPDKIRNMLDTLHEAAYEAQLRLGWAEEALLGRKPNKLRETPELAVEGLYEEEKEAYKKLVQEDSQGTYMRLIELHQLVWQYQFDHHMQKEFAKVMERIVKEEDDWQISFANNRSPVGQAESLILTLRRQKNEAYATLGSFMEHILITLAALQMVGKQCYGNNHTIRNQRLDMLMNMLEETRRLLSQDREKGPGHFQHEYFNRKDWEFRRVCGELHRAKRELEELKKKLGKTEEDNVITDDEINF